MATAKQLANYLNGIPSGTVGDELHYTIPNVVAEFIGRYDIKGRNALIKSHPSVEKHTALIGVSEELVSHAVLILGHHYNKLVSLDDLTGTMGLEIPADILAKYRDFDSHYSARGYTVGVYPQPSHFTLLAVVSEELAFGFRVMLDDA